MKKLEIQQHVGTDETKIVPVEIEETDILLKACKVSYENKNMFSKFCLGYERIEATSLPLLTALPPIEELVSEVDPEHDKKFIYKAAKLLVVVKIEKNFYEPSAGDEIQEKALHGFVNGVQLHDALEETIGSQIGMEKEEGENYEEITVYQTQDHAIKRMWVETKSHAIAFSHDSSHEINIMIQTKDDAIFCGIIEVEDAQKFLADIFYNDAFCND